MVPAWREAMEPVDKETLLTQVRSGEVTVLDVRPTEEYQAGHIPGALSVPLDELEQHLAELAHDRRPVGNGNRIPGRLSALSGSAPGNDYHRQCGLLGEADSRARAADLAAAAVVLVPLGGTSYPHTVYPP